MTDSPTILVVDDEPRGVQVLARTLWEVGRVLGAESGERAWEIFCEEPRIDLVIADQRMPGMTGVELLTRVAERDPHVGRILLTGYSDHAATVEAINHGRVHAYLGKPCLPERLLICVRSVLDRAQLSRQNDALLGRLHERNSQLEAALGDLHTAQERMFHAERLSAISRFTSAIVHDLRGPLTVIGSSARELVSGGEALGEARIRALGETLQAESERMSQMCRDLLEVASFGSGRPRLGREPLDEVVEAATASLRAEAGHQRVRIEADLAARVSLQLDPERLQRALAHLLCNALEAMPEGGSLRVATRVEGPWAVVSVDDSGPGIPEELHARLLEPFVTRGKPGCNGLGLAVVKKVVDDHRGRIEVGKSKAGGARLEVYLPLGSESGRGLLPARRGAASIG